MAIIPLNLKQALHYDKRHTPKASKLNKHRGRVLEEMRYLIKL